MKRRDAIKNMSLSLGYVVAAPTVLNILSSCTADGPTWTAAFFNSPEKQMVTHLVDIIMPATDIPGALDVNVPQFLDKMYAKIEGENSQNRFRKGATIFAQEFKKLFQKDVETGTKAEVKELFGVYFDLSKDQIEKVLDEQNQNEKNVSAGELDTYMMYKFLFSVRQYALYGYYTSEKVGEEILNYDPVPGSFEPCVPLSEIGNSWSL